MQPPIDVAEVVAEVTAAHERYEAALANNDLESLEELFWNDPRCLRFGPNGTLIGHAAISAYRRRRVGDGPKRHDKRLHVVTFGRDFAVTSQESTRVSPKKITRQSQTWIRTPQGWRIVAAHVSDMP